MKKQKVKETAVQHWFCPYCGKEDGEVVVFIVEGQQLQYLRGEIDPWDNCNRL